MGELWADSHAAANVENRRCGHLPPCEKGAERARCAAMKIGIAKERQAGETRVAASPDTVKKFVGLGFAVAVESGAGGAASIPDSAYQTAGATIAPDERS